MWGRAAASVAGVVETVSRAMPATDEAACQQMLWHRSVLVTSSRKFIDALLLAGDFYVNNSALPA
jgi:hypothetical protein